MGPRYYFERTVNRIRLVWMRKYSKITPNLVTYVTSSELLLIEMRKTIGGGGLWVKIKSRALDIYI